MSVFAARQLSDLQCLWVEKCVGVSMRWFCLIRHFSINFTYGRIWVPNRHLSMTKMTPTMCCWFILWSREIVRVGRGATDTYPWCKSECQCSIPISNSSTTPRRQLSTTVEEKIGWIARNCPKVGQRQTISINKFSKITNIRNGGQRKWW